MTQFLPSRMEARAWTRVVPSGRAPNQELRPGSPDSKWDLLLFGESFGGGQQSVELERGVVVERVAELEGGVVEVVGEEGAIVEGIGDQGSVITLRLMHGEGQDCGCHGVGSSGRSVTFRSLKGSAEGEIA